MVELQTQTPRQTAAAAKRFAAALPPPPLHVHLRGELGAGKTLWARALISALGGGRAPSPSFALVLSYSPPAMPVHHMDLFRLPRRAPLPEELAELMREKALFLIEWPERASDTPAADVELSFIFCGEGRRLKFSASGAKGKKCLQEFSR